MVKSVYQNQQLTWKLLCCCLGLSCLWACSSHSDKAFTLLTADDTGLNFRNLLKESENFNIFKYQYFYNGGGVAVADFNNDGLQDVFFTGNMVKNRLFVNKGNLTFDDKTEKSNLAKAEGWCTGVNAVDINQDGWMDLYICRAGYPFENLRKNLLYINNKDLTFTESAAQYGLDDAAYSTQSAFFDYDRDGDIDMFLLNHSTPEFSKGSLEIYKLKNQRQIPYESKLYRNDDGHFTNVAEQAGIVSNVLSFGLGLSIADFNNDGWQDIFVGNDFNESDYFYINNQDGTFSEKAKSCFEHTSMFTMGCDVADLNHDGYLDLMALDMLPESNYLQKVHSGADNYNKIRQMIDNGFQPQFSKNILQMSNANGRYAEVGQMYGVANTDWSWAPLFVDFENDGFDDLFISNGYLRDHTDMDFLQYSADIVQRADRGEKPVEFEAYIASMPPIIQPNYFYSNTKGRKFENKANDWGIATPSVSHGSAYADFDNDGDMDLVCSNSGEYAYLYRNNLIKNNNHYVGVTLTGLQGNRDAIGARVKVCASQKAWFKDQQPCRGFQSSVDYRLHFGLGHTNRVDSIVVIWPQGQKQTFTNVEIDKINNLKQNATATFPKITQSTTSTYFIEDQGIASFQLKKDNFDDFKVQGLLPYALTDQCPKMVAADFNADGRMDFIIGGNALTPSTLYTQLKNGDFTATAMPSIKGEISDIEVVDDGKFPSLAIAVGSYQYDDKNASKGIYILNNVNGKWQSPKHIPTPGTNPSAIACMDVNADGRKDILIGGQYSYSQFPNPSQAMILLATANGFSAPIPLGQQWGKVNDIAVADIDKDGSFEALIAADWQPVSIWKFVDHKPINVSSTFLKEQENGLWKTVAVVDVDKDGKNEIVAGNFGLNSQWSASKTHPLSLYYDDLDVNGSYDPIIAYYVMDDIYPFPPREDVVKQVPLLNKQFQAFSTYAKANIQRLLSAFPSPKLVHHASCLESSVWALEGKTWARKPLPSEMQVAPLYCFAQNPNTTSELSLCYAGNQSKVRVKLGMLTGHYGEAWSRKKDIISTEKTGLDLSGDARSLLWIPSVKGDLLVCSFSNQKSKFYRYVKQ